MKADFRTITNKDLFMSKLSGEPIHFGFIPVWRLGAFVRYCLKNEIITKRDPNNRRNPWYTAHYDFVYVATYSFASTPLFARVMVWVADLTGKRLRWLWRPLYTGRETIDCGPTGPSNNYLISNGLYIS